MRLRGTTPNRSGGAEDRLPAVEHERAGCAPSRAGDKSAGGLPFLSCDAAGTDTPPPWDDARTGRFRNCYCFDDNTVLPPYLA
jgi:hypothetical protein